ncbi:hypothetical protein A2335_02125, partial [Candidatus Peregrinibacteria bacterium RIFOXYB2_FULL_32_7]
MFFSACAEKPVYLENGVTMSHSGQTIAIERQTHDPIYALYGRHGLLRNVESTRNSIMVGRLRIINQGSETVRIKNCVLIFSSKGREYQRTTLDDAWLEREAKPAYAYLQSSVVQKFYKAVSFYQGNFTSKIELKTNEALPIFNQYFDFYTPEPIDNLEVRCQLADGNQASSNFKITEYVQKNRYDFPMKGSDLITFGNPYQIWGHRTMPHAEFGFDVQILGRNGRVYEGSPSNPNNHFCMGRSIYAPADGTVVEVLDGLPDNPKAYNRQAFTKHFEKLKDQFPAIQLNGGNMILIDHGNQEYSFLIHLLKNSIRIKKGEQVKRGALLAKCGHSGEGSTSPHLHFHFGNRSDMLTSTSLPIVFDNVD